MDDKQVSLATRVVLDVRFPESAQGPESVTVEWENVVPAIEELSEVVEAVGVSLRPDEVRYELAPQPVGHGPDPAVVRCRRLVCGHSSRDHGSTAGTSLVGPMAGACTLCENPEKCASFVGADLGFVAADDLEQGARIAPTSQQPNELGLITVDLNGDLSAPLSGWAAEFLPAGTKLVLSGISEGRWAARS
jgi:hypothetical protein